MDNKHIEFLFHGESTEVLKSLEDNSIDSVVCDPPYGLSKEPDISKVISEWVNGDDSFVPDGKGFMSKEWDGFVPPPSLWKEVHRVLKPGGHALVFAGTRKQDLMMIRIRLACFEVSDVIEWMYFSGFPKSHDVSKEFDRRGNYELSEEYSGWGTALKPAHEPVIVVRKPLIDADTGRKLTVADCVEKYGTGAINIDASRIATFGEDAEKHKAEWNRTQSAKQSDTATFLSPKEKEADLRAFAKDGRFPANCITLDSDEFYSKYFNVGQANVSQANISPEELSKKASKKDRNSDWQGEEIDGNVHPTVKPTDLMAWLVRLVTPIDGTVLDPFAGSGSTLVAAKREGFGFIGVELTEEYIPIIEARTGIEAEGQAKE